MSEFPIFIDNLSTENYEVKGKIIVTDVVISNLATGGPIGLASATVDSAPGAQINQTTTGQTLTIPNPTNATQKSTFQIVNAGTVPFFIGDTTFYPRTGVLYQWTGTNWAILGPAASTVDMSTITIPDKPAGGSIGTAVTTVDVTSSFNINQTTASQTLTMPSPNNTTIHKIITVNNVGSTSFTMFGSIIYPNGGSMFQWNGTNWSSFSGAVSGAWAQGGNTVGTLKTLGTLDAVALSIITNGNNRIQITSAGLVGVATANPQTGLDVNGGIALRKYPSDINDPPSPLNPGDHSVIRLTGGFVDVLGIIGGVDGRILTILTTATMLRIFHEEVTELTPANRIITGRHGTVLYFMPGDAVSLYYDSTATRWKVISNTLPGYATGTSTVFGYGTTTVGVGDVGNTAFGATTLAVATNASYDNTAVGTAALNANTDGNSNTGLGGYTLSRNTTGVQNTAAGTFAANFNTIGESNCAYGFGSLVGNTSGSNNTALGTQSLGGTTTGSNNIGIGLNAGSSLAGVDSNNVCIAHVGQAGDSGAIRIGTSAVHTSCYIQGISGATVGASATVIVNAAGQLGTVVSSARFKENIRDMARDTDFIYWLRPVTFNYKSDKNKTRHFGLIAEEVESVNKDLVVYDTDGRIQTVQYHELVPMLLNEVQKLNARVKTLEGFIEKMMTK